MILLGHLRQPFCYSPHLNSLRGILSAHIISILEQDQQDKYQDCLQYMQQAVKNSSDIEARVKCNMIFNTQAVSNSLQHLRGSLAKLVLQDRIQSQYELDQLLKWLSKQIKINNSLGQVEILQKLSLKEQQKTKFEQQLQQIASHPPEDANASMVCKWLRNKYTTIDSKHIFQCVSSIFSGRAQLKKKEVPVWQKIKDVKPRQLKLECNTKEIYEMHQQITKGQQRFRFPPEPNGHLHIGHLKAIRINFQTAIHLQGHCYLRFDDTNPEVEEHQFIDEIEENIKWLGYTPSKVTFTSDYFEPLMHYAHELIKNGHAYVCESSQEEIEAERKEKRENPYRNRPVETSLKIFPNLTGNQTLRFKGIPQSPNPTLRDPIIYRQKSSPHPRTHRKYKIYPTYDFSHCISDSIEHIDYSLCSLQFQIRRQLYYSFLDLLGLWKPVVWQYSRLNIEDNVLSKRTIKKFIETGVVDNWSDPRLLTLRGLKARGYTPKMLFQFIDKISCTRSGNENIIQYGLLQQEMKKTLTQEAPKAMAVLSPIPVKINNFQGFWPQSNQLYTNLEQNIFLDEADVSCLEEGNKFILKNIGIFNVQTKNYNNIAIRYLPQESVSALKKQQPRTKVLHWINQSQSIDYKVVLFNRVLTPTGEPNPQSRVEHSRALIPKQLLKSRPAYVQFERVGFFKFSDGKQQLLLCTRL